MRTAVTTQHTFTFGSLRTVFESLPAERSTGTRPGSWELISAQRADGREVELDELCAELAANGEDFTPDTLTELLWQEAERDGQVSHVAIAA